MTHRLCWTLAALLAVLLAPPVLAPPVLAPPILAAEPGEGSDSEEEKKSAPEPEKEIEIPHSPNLDIPADLPEKVRQEMEEAVKIFKEAKEGKSGASRTLNRAIEKLRVSSQKASKSPLPLYYMGIAYQLKRNFPEAKKVLEKALKLNPRFHEALVELADVHVHMKDPKGSLSFYEKALEIQPGYPPALQLKMYALIRLGRFKEALTYLDEIGGKNPGEDLKRLRVRLDVEIKGPGWSRIYNAQTPDFEVHTSVSQEFADEIAQHAGYIRRAYDKVFSDIKKPERKYPIWVYPDSASYHRAGAPPQVGGHYDTQLRKLVLFRYPKKEQTIAVLYHEAFHQYIHDYLEDAPQWFNEGLAEYFGAFQYQRQGIEEKMVVRPQMGRLRDIQMTLKLAPSPTELMGMTRQEMYDPRMGAIHYAQAWSLIYFMLEGRPQYRPLLVNYFKALQKGKDLQEAYQTTFGRVDMSKFDKEWRGYVQGLGAK